MFRKPAFWAAFLIIAAACAVYTAIGFPRAFPLVNLDLKMDRQAALDTARRLADEHGWGPGGYQQAADFDLDDEVRNFVELEEGRDAYIELLGSGLYSPYTWRVRHFKPGDANETLIRFTPAGDPYGFREQLPEDEPGASLDAADARSLAQSAAVRNWGIDLEQYEFAEHRQEIRPGGRTDHTFVYERPQTLAGEGRYRLELVVAGDRLTELSHVVKIPEAFERSFRKMRSANEAIAVAATVAMGLVLIGGSIVGLFFLLRERWVLWKQPLLWGVLVSSGMALLTVNQWPLAWMDYDTAVSPANFLMERIALLAGQFLGLGLLYTLSFMAAECLTRRAFPGQIQFWRSWRPAVAASPGLLGRTVAGYLLVAVDLAFLVMFYAFALDKLGWWSPSEALLDPNVLATPMPWLTAIAISLQAGFWEECLFRGVPLAGAALLGRRFGGTKYWIIGALILQALMFGAGHASYPTQPAYARVVELFLPAVFWGLIYLAFGLLPVIILHFTFDVLLISLPLWVSAAPGLLDDRVIIVALTLVPLWVVLHARWRQGRWSPVGGEHLNGAWSPPAVEAKIEAAPAGRQAGIASGARGWLWGLGVAGVFAWVAMMPRSTDAPPLRADRTEALAAAASSLADRGLAPGENYRRLANVEASPAETHRFVWQEGDPELYDRLLGEYLPEPRWRVRYATFGGDVAASAEEFQVWVDASGTVTRVRHVLPEAAPGADLEEDEARELARSAVRREYGIDPDSLTEVVKSPSKEESRTDWHFEFSDPDALAIEGAEARVAVDIAGDEVSDTGRYVHVPEEWERQERNRGSLAQATQIACLVLGLGAFLAGGVFGIIRWSRGRFDVRVFVAFALLLAAMRLILMLSGWPAATAQFQTEVPFKLQAVLFVVIGVIVALSSSVFVALNLGVLERWRPAPPAAPGPARLISGLTLATLVAGVAASINAIAPQTSPRWPAYAPAGTAVPWLTAMLGPVSGFITTATLLLLVFVAADRWSASWTRRKGLTAIVLFLAGLVLAGMQSVESLPSWLAAGALAGAGMWAAYVWLLRFDLTLIPVAAGTLAALEAARSALAPAYPGALTGSLGAVVLLALVAVRWQASLSRQEAGGAS